MKNLTGEIISIQIGSEILPVSTEATLTYIPNTLGVGEVRNSFKYKGDDARKSRVNVDKLAALKASLNR